MALLWAALWVAATMISSVAAQSTQAEITSITTDDDTYASGEEVRIEFVVRDRRNATTQGNVFTYGAAIVIEDSERRVVYSSRDVNLNRTITLAPGEFGTVVFRWNMPSGAIGGEYSILGSLHDEEYQAIYDLWEVGDGASFMVEEGIKMAVSPEEFDFGTIDFDDTPGRSFSVVNEGVGTLVWEVTDWPRDWLILEDPLQGETRRDRGRIRVEVKDDIPFGEFEGNIEVESNGGNLSIPVSVLVRGNPNGNVTRVNVEGESRYVQGDFVEVDVRVENTGDVTVAYRVTLLIENSGQDAYDSNLAGEDQLVVLEPERAEDVTFFWEIPSFARRGDYVVTAELRNWHDFQCVLHPLLDCGRFQSPSPDADLVCADAESDDSDETPTPTPTPRPTSTGTVTPIPPRFIEVECDTFEVRLSPPRLLISPSSHGFGGLDLGETPEMTFEVTNPGRGTLVWEVTSVPDWLELVRPTSSVTGEGEFVVRVSDSAPGGRLTGEIAVESTGGNDIVSVSVSIDAPDPTRTPTPTPTQTSTPTPTATSTPVTPTATPEPLVFPPSVLNGTIAVRDGSIPQGATLIGRIGSYESPPAFIEDGQYSNLVISPIGEEYLGQSIKFLLDGVEASNPVRPIFFIPNTFREVNLIFDGVGALEPTPVPPTATFTVTSTPVPPTATSTLPPPVFRPAATNTPTVTSTPTPKVVVVVVVTSSPTAQNLDQGNQGGSSVTSANEPPGPQGACGAARGHVSLWTGIANTLFIFAPLGTIAGYRRWRKG